MYRIERKDYGFRLTFQEFIKSEEMKEWLDESKDVLADVEGEFGVFVDMRTLKPLSGESQDHMHEGQKLYKMKGMTRSVVIVDSVITKMQFQRIAKETGIYKWERYIDASSILEWEKVGIDWIVNTIDPDEEYK
jgi:hypothetical protein